MLVSLQNINGYILRIQVRGVKLHSIEFTVIWDPTPILSITNNWWFVICIDDCTLFSWIHLLKHKSEVGHVIQSFFEILKTQFWSESEEIQV